MTEYNYDREDIYPPDFRDDYRVRYYDRSYDETWYYEYGQYHERSEGQRRSEHLDHRQMYESRMRNIQLRQTYLDGFARPRVLARAVPIESFSIQDYFN
jgi:hypothetical protein